MFSVLCLHVFTILGNSCFGFEDRILSLVVFVPGHCLLSTFGLNINRYFNDECL